VDCFQWYERPENSPVDCFQRGRVGRPPSDGSADPRWTGRQTPVERVGRPRRQVKGNQRRNAGTAVNPKGLPVSACADCVVSIRRIGTMHLRRRKCIFPNLETDSRVLRKQYDFRPFQSHVPALPVHVDSHKGRACPPDWESIPASQEIRVVRREFPRSLSSRGKSSDFSRQAHAFMREP
jgi:hypothetical protein